MSAAPEQAREALRTVEAMSRAGSRRGVPPRWIGAGMALSLGFLWSLNSFLGDGWATLAALAVAPCYVFVWPILVRRSGATGRYFWGDMGWLGWSYGLSGLVLMILAGWGDRNGMEWSWAAAGAVLAMNSMIYYEIARRAWMRGRPAKSA